MNEQAKSTDFADPNGRQQLSKLTPIRPLAGGVSNDLINHKAPTLDLQSLASHYALVRFGAEVARFYQFPVNTAILSVMGILSGYAGLKYCVQYPNEQRLPIGLYVVGEQPPAAAKSSVLRTAATPCLKAIKGVNESRRDAATDDEPAKILRILGSNATPEALETDYAKQNDGYFSLFSAEQGLSDVLLGLTSDRKADNDLLLKGFNGEWHSASRVTRQGYQGFVHGAVTLLAQSGSIDTILAKSNGTGIAERFLMLSEPTLLGQRQFGTSKPSAINGKLREDYAKAVNDIADWLLQTNHYPALDNLVSLEIEPKGWEAIANKQQEIEPLLADGALYSHGILRGIFGKIDIQIMKLAATLHIAERLMMGQEVGGFIPYSIVIVAINMAEALAANVRQILEEKGMIGKSAECEAILRMFDNAQCKTEREIIQSRSRVIPFKDMTGSKSDAIRAALRECIGRGFLTILAGTPERYRMV
ncbi:DUF3987 domain-containing protein [Shewanella bicestrii]|uniref:DUF3987 domain-containing protein n=1 Tax=Shewanella TaxID=22 RepID=UPI000849D46E|nr:MULTISPECIES: DUF3987 domain-containing protein [Shewanella]ODR84938.1 hypothetical protein ABT47_06205 [Shewanella xiamenensis]